MIKICPRESFIKDCEKVYIGQTLRALRSRTRAHKRAVYPGDKNSLLAQECLQNNHEFDFDHVKIIDRCSEWSRRLSLEAWHAISEPNSISDHIHIPDMNLGQSLVGSHLLTSFTSWLVNARMRNELVNAVWGKCRVTTSCKTTYIALNYRNNTLTLTPTYLTLRLHEVVTRSFHWSLTQL